MTSDNQVVITTENVVLVQSQDSTTIPALDILGALRSFAGDLTKSVSVGAPLQKSSRKDGLSDLFGSWVESGDEDKDLETLYRQRHLSSSRPADEE